MATPRELIKTKQDLADEFAKLGEELISLKTKEAFEMPILMAEHSVASAERIWNASEDGIKLMTIKIKMKCIEKLISATSSRLKVAEMEQYNLS